MEAFDLIAPTILKAVVGAFVGAGSYNDPIFHRALQELLVERYPECKETR